MTLPPNSYYTNMFGRPFFTKEAIEETIRMICPIDKIEVNEVGPGHIQVHVFGDDLPMQRIADAVYLISPAYMLVEVLAGPPKTKARKYPNDCPCGIAAVRCEYHKDL